jgi:hypothetical protein
VSLPLPRTTFRTRAARHRRLHGLESWYFALRHAQVTSDTVSSGRFVDEPVLDTQLADVGEVPDVARDERGVAREHDGGDAQVRLGDALSRTLQPGAQLSVALRGVLVERRHAEHRHGA